MRAVAIVICLMLVAGCGGPDVAEPTAGSAAEPTTGTTAEPTAATTETTDAADPCETALQTAPSRKLASIAPIEDETRTLATSWVMFEDIHQLAWASHLIVRGHVVADCGADDKGSQQSFPDGDMRMLVEIDALYRGQPRDSILVPITSDGFSSDSSMMFEIGNHVVLFLSQPQGGGAFPVGGPQGHWRVVSDQVFPNAGHFANLPVDTFEQSLAAALHQDPPVSPQSQVPSLDLAPLGPDLPDDR
ncbi:MAG TPA: hypothetical protein VEX37_10245 [Thermomicrobiales bacterium]|nr:hypothetical protein [Thermomicrobiales bacterium]